MDAALRPVLSQESLKTGLSKTSLATSGILHLIVMLFLIFGLPHLMPPPPEYHPPVDFTIVDVAPITNTNTTPTPKDQPTPPPPKPQPQQPQQPTPPTPPKPAEPTPTPPKPPEPKPPEPEPKPEPKAEAIKPIVKPTPPKPDTHKTDQDMNKLLKSLQIQKDTPPPAPKTTETKADSKTTTPAQTKAPSLSDRLTISEEDLLRRQIESCWNPPIGAKDAQTLVVVLSIDVNSERVVTNVDIVDKSRYNTDGFFRAAADAARRAVLNPNCSPLQVPPDKYDTWKHINFTFDPRDML